MKKELLFLSLSMILLLTPQFVLAQTKFEVHVGGAFPEGDFSRYNFDQAIFGNSGCAETGVDLGVKLFRPSSGNKNLYFTLSLDVINNALSKKFTDEIGSSMRASIENPNVKLSMTYPSYTNCPIMLGLSYNIPLDTRNDFYFDGGLGVNFISVSDMTLTAKYNGLSASETVSTESSQAFAGQIGVGVLFEKKINLGINYNLLGSYELHGKDKASNDSETTIPSTGTMSERTLNIYLGYRF